MPEKPWIQVAAALLENQGRYLITRRKADVHLGGMWEFPGGKCEAGEPFEFCLKRELLEELGIEITQPQFFMALDHEYPEKKVELRFFSCSILYGKPKPLECAEIRWVKVENLRDFEILPADAPVVSLLLSQADRVGEP